MISLEMTTNFCSVINEIKDSKLIYQIKQAADHLKVKQIQEMIKIPDHKQFTEFNNETNISSQIVPLS